MRERRLGLRRVVDTGGFERGKRIGWQRVESYGLVGWLKDDRRLNHNVKAAAEASVAGFRPLPAWRSGELACGRGYDFTTNQLYAREQQNDYRSDPKDRELRRHSRCSIFAQVSYRVRYRFRPWTTSNSKQMTIVLFISGINNCETPSNSLVSDYVGNELVRG